MTHVDRFIDSASRNGEGERYARWFLALHRFPAVLLTDFEQWISQYQLYCTYEGERYRVTGASRLGDIWLTKDFTRTLGYDLRVDVDQCSQWNPTP